MVNCFSILGQGGFWVINKRVAKLTSINAAIMVADLASKREYFLMNKDITLEDGWFFNTQENIQLDTSLSPHEQRKACELLVSKGFLEIKKVGIPAKNHFKLNDSQLLKFLTTSDEKFERLEVKNFNDIYNNNKEITIKDIHATLPLTESSISQSDIDRFNHYVAWAKSNCEKLLKITKPLTAEQFVDIRNKYSLEQFKEICFAMEAKKDFLKKYDNLNLTMKSWLKRQFGEGGSSEPPPKTPLQKGIQMPKLVTPVVNFEDAI
jgi:hypothetical protein